ncbi:MAG: hypothetical protein H8M99_12845 [Gloeobacteraceae cyanobacterium ES-bin-144]|nr:hypothetical protein [Verrucomicrobiales bacterium]
MMEAGFFREIGGLNFFAPWFRQIEAMQALWIFRSLIFPVDACLVSVSKKVTQTPPNERNSTIVNAHSIHEEPALHQ